MTIFTPQAGLTATALLALASTASAQLGNDSYDAGKLHEPISMFNGDTMVGPQGSNTVTMLRKHLLVMASKDSGKPPGAFNVFDVTNPSSPVRVADFEGGKADLLRELHAMPIAVVDGRDILVFPSITGIQLWDFTNPMKPTFVSELDLDGVNGGDYTEAVWQLSLAYPYVFAAATGSGMYVIDISDLDSPKVHHRATRDDVGVKGQSITLAGNYVIMQSDNAHTVTDVSDPAAPQLLHKHVTEDKPYSALVVGDRLYLPKEQGHFEILGWHPESGFESLDTLQTGGDKGGYCTYQDGYAFCGQSGSGYFKLDTAGDKLREVAQGQPSFSGDFDFATVLGNLVYLGNDHSEGAALMPHQASPDLTGPEVEGIYPLDLSTNVAPTTRVTVFFSDQVSLNGLTEESIFIRPVGEQPTDAVLSISSFNAVSIGSKAPLDPDTTYEVVVRANGVQDVMGNSTPEQVITRFSTGDELAESIPDSEIEPPPEDISDDFGAGKDFGNFDDAPEDGGDGGGDPDSRADGLEGNTGCALSRPPIHSGLAWFAALILAAGVATRRRVARAPK